LDDWFCVLFMSETIGLTCGTAFAGFDIVRRRQGGHAPVRGGEHNLIGVFLPEVAHRENARNIRLTFFVREDITGAIHLDPGGNQQIIRRKADKNENAFGIDMSLRPGLRVLQGNVTDPVIVPVDGGHNRIVNDFNPWFLENPLLKDAAAPEGVPPVDEIDLAGDL
jgi:hypothetical protein